MVQMIQMIQMIQIAGTDQFIRRFIAIVSMLFLAAGCVVTPSQPEPPSLDSTARQEIGHLAVRGPTRPKISLTSDLQGKGAAAGRTAASASSSWVNGVVEGAGSSGEEGAIFIAALGLMMTPIVAAGGAAYGATAADSKDTVTEGNLVLGHTLDFAPAQLEHALSLAFAESTPVTYEFVPAGIPDAELIRRGFDSVLDVQMDSISSHPSQNLMHVYFDLRNRVRLTDLDSGQILGNRVYNLALMDKSVSGWAGQEGALLTAELDETYAELAEDLTDHLFHAPAIRVRGLQPLSANPYRVGTIPGRRPMFVWSALDGGSRTAPQAAVEYELALMVGKKEQLSYRTHEMRFVPDESLTSCKVYRWQVRAHYTSFGEPVTSEWSPGYRFKTSCD